jgi:hypothetical protein
LLHPATHSRRQVDDRRGRTCDSLSPRAGGVWGEGASPLGAELRNCLPRYASSAKLRIAERPPHPRSLRSHSRSFGSAFFTSRTASEGRLRSPRAAGRGEISDLVLAMQLHPGFAARTKATDVSPPNKKGRRSAGRRKSNWPHHTNRCCHPSALRARRASRTIRTVRFGRARLSALHHGARQAVTPDSTSGRASWNHRVQTGGPSPMPVQRAPRGPVIVPDGTMPEAARERFARPPAGTALAPLSGSHLESALVERDGGAISRDGNEGQARSTNFFMRFSKSLKSNLFAVKHLL